MRPRQIGVVLLGGGERGMQKSSLVALHLVNIVLELGHFFQDLTLEILGELDQLLQRRVRGRSLCRDGALEGLRFGSKFEASLIPRLDLGKAARRASILGGRLASHRRAIYVVEQLSVEVYVRFLAGYA